jgi:hypothetical protein
MRLIAIGMLFLAAACGGSKSSPTPAAPTTVAPAAPTVTGLSIRGTSGFRTGQTDTLRAEVTLSNGTTRAASSPTWNTTNSVVATVDASGAVSAVGHGTANITVSAEGQNAQFGIQVWQDYQGTWLGTYVINVCNDAGSFSTGSFCRSFPRGTVLPFRLILTQNTGSASGTLELGSFTGPMRGAIFDTRRFVGAATVSTVIEGVPFNGNVGTFSVLSTGNSLTGNLVVGLTSPLLSGSGYWEATLGTVARSVAPTYFDTREFESKLLLLVR